MEHGATHPSAENLPDFVDFIRRVVPRRKAEQQPPVREADGFEAVDLCAGRTCSPPPRRDYPRQVAYFLPQERRSDRSPIRTLRLGGLLKAATEQLRIGLPATGLR